MAHHTHPALADGAAEAFRGMPDLNAATATLGPPSWLETPYAPGPLSREQFDQFFRDGFVVVGGLLDPEDDLADVVSAVDGLVGSVMDRLVAGGKLDATVAAEINAESASDEDRFLRRLLRLEAACPGASVLVHKNGILDPSIAELWSKPTLLDVAAQLLASNDVEGHPVWNLRAKPPRNAPSTVPWHQDAGYLHPDAAHTLQVTAWIPLVDAHEGNGTLQVLRGGHLTGNTAAHECCAGDTWYISLADGWEDTLGGTEVVTCEVPKGSVLLLNNLVPHRSLDNLSDAVRWSLDLRWQRPGEPNGFWGLKDNILMRSESDPSHQPDWESWGAVSRQDLDSSGKARTNVVDDDLDMTISGVWMMRWHLVNHNTHTHAFVEAEGIDLSGGEDGVPASN